jgi:predicted nucleic acid-binding Zn ribbon protein
MTEMPLKQCPLCKGKVQRLISAGVGLIFKGSGFYINDYARSEDYKKKTKEEKTSSTSSVSSDKKPDSTSSTTTGKEKKTTTPTGKKTTSPK